MTQESGTGEIRENELTQFKELIAGANGSLISLEGRKSRLGEPFFITARIGQDAQVPEEGVKFLNIDIFVRRGEEYIPVGIRDYEIKDNVASGNKQRHQHLARYNQAQKAADRFWSTGEGLHVIDMSFINYAMQNGGFSKMNEMRAKGIITTEDQWNEPIYQNYGLGGLMVAASLLVLQRYGVETVKFISLTEPAIKTWGKFGYQGQANMLVEELVRSPQVDKSIEPFIISQ